MLESVSIASALSTALAIYPCQIRVKYTVCIFYQCYLNKSASYRKRTMRLEFEDKFLVKKIRCVSHSIKNMQH